MRFKRLIPLLLALLALSAGPAVRADEPVKWWNAAWPYRLALHAGPGEGDVAEARVYLGGRAAKDGHDLRLIDDAGQMAPFEVVHHDPLLDTFLRIRVPDDKPAAYFLYFGNDSAVRFDPRQPTPKGEPWRPRRGLWLTTFAMGDEKPPTTVEAFTQLTSKSRTQGACIRDAVSDGFNRFAASTRCMSVYEGYLRIEKPGIYSFCSVSENGSWIEVNDKIILSWPGSHGIGGAIHGQKNGSIQLAQGVARIRYRQESREGRSMAFMGWKPPGADRFSAIPPSQWTHVRKSEAGAIQSSKRGPIAQPRAEVVSTYWVPETDGLQATFVRLTAEKAGEGETGGSARWELGDGVKASGTGVGHVYFGTDRPTVKLTVTDSAGRSDQAILSPNIFLVDVESNYFKIGNAEQYAQVLRDYDPQSLNSDSLANLAVFWQKTENPSRQAQTVEAYLKRFPQGPDAVELAGDAAQAYLSIENYDPKRADALLAQALEKLKGNADRLPLMLDRARLLAWDLGELEQARRLFENVLEATSDDRPPRFLVRKHQQEARAVDLKTGALIGLGDVALLAHDFAKARPYYEKAQTRSARNLALAAVTAQIGSYAYTVDDLLSRGQKDYALKTLDEVEGRLPTVKLDTQSIFLRGKVLYIIKPGDKAVRYLELAQTINPGAVTVPEAVWLHACCLMDMGKYKPALEQFQRIRSDFTTSEFFTRAEAKITACQKALAGEERK